MRNLVFIMSVVILILVGVFIMVDVNKEVERNRVEANGQNFEGTVTAVRTGSSGQATSYTVETDDGHLVLDCCLAVPIWYEAAAEEQLIPVGTRVLGRQLTNGRNYIDNKVYLNQDVNSPRSGTISIGGTNLTVRDGVTTVTDGDTRLEMRADGCVIYNSVINDADGSGFVRKFTIPSGDLRKDKITLEAEHIGIDIDKDRIEFYNPNPNPDEGRGGKYHSVVRSANALVAEYDSDGRLLFTTEPDTTLETDSAPSKSGGVPPHTHPAHSHGMPHNHQIKTQLNITNKYFILDSSVVSTQLRIAKGTRLATPTPNALAVAGAGNRMVSRPGTYVRLSLIHI